MWTTPSRQMRKRKVRNLSENFKSDRNRQSQIERLNKRYSTLLTAFKDVIYTITVKHETDIEKDEAIEQLLTYSRFHGRRGRNGTT